MFAGTAVVVNSTVSLLREKGVDIQGVALFGSRARDLQHGQSDVDLLILSNSPCNMHIEDICIRGQKVQFFLMPMKTLDDFLVLNTVAGNGIVASTFHSPVIFEGDELFLRINSNLRKNLSLVMQIERQSVNKNLSRLRNRISRLVKDLSNSTNANEDIHTGAELLKAAGQFLLAKKSRFFLPTEKHLHRELAKCYPEEVAQDLAQTYKKAVATTDYSGLLSYCTEYVLDGNVLSYASSSDSSSELQRNIGCHIVFINSYSIKLVQLIYRILKSDNPQIVLNQDRDLLHLGVYFIVDTRDFSTFQSRFEALPLTRQEFSCVTVNYQLDHFLLQHFRKYDHEGLLSELSKFVMDHALNRDIVMNSVFDWLLNTGISLYDRLSFDKYVQECVRMYRPSMPHEPERFDLDRTASLNKRIDRDLSMMDISSISARYRGAIITWSCADLTDDRIRRKITEAYQHNLASASNHSMFSDDRTFSNFFHLFESIFNCVLLKHRERGLLYLLLAKALARNDINQ